MSAVLAVVEAVFDHSAVIALVVTPATVGLIAWGFRRDARQDRAIRSACAEWEATGKPVPGWGPGWAWSGSAAGPEDDQAEDVEDLDDEDAYPATLAADVPVEVRPFRPSVRRQSAVCGSCRGALATTTVVYSDGHTFDVCSDPGCLPPDIELDDHAPTTFGRSA